MPKRDRTVYTPAASCRNWPQAAAMSRPRLARMWTLMPASLSTPRKPRTSPSTGRLKGKPGDFVVTDEVDVAAELAADADQFVGVLGQVVDAAEQDVLQRDLAAGGVEVVAAGVDEVLNGDEAGPGDDLFAKLVVGGVQADGEGDGQVEGGEFADAHGHADGADGDLAGAQAQTPVGGEGGEGGQHVFEVGHGFAHAHEDEVAEPADAGQPVQLPGLLDDLPGGEVAVEPAQARGAELAADRAADLTGDAGGAARAAAAIMIRRNHDALGAVPGVPGGLV